MIASIFMNAIFQRRHFAFCLRRNMMCLPNYIHGLTDGDNSWFFLEETFCFFQVDDLELHYVYSTRIRTKVIQPWTICFDYSSFSSKYFRYFVALTLLGQLQEWSWTSHNCIYIHGCQLGTLCFHLCLLISSQQKCGIL